MKQKTDRRGWTTRPGVVRVGWLCGALMLAASIAPSAADASTYRWQVDANGDWNNPANWAVVEGPAGAGYPNLAGDVAVFDQAPTAIRVVTVPDTVNITIGRIVFDYESEHELIITGAGSGALVFDNLGEDAIIESNGTGERSLMTAQLNADLVFSGSADPNGDVVSASFSESGGARNVTITGASLSLGTSTYTGTTTVANGSLRVSSNSVSIPGLLIVGDGTGAASSAIAIINGNALNPASSVTVNSDGEARFGRIFLQTAILNIGDLSVFDGTVGISTFGAELTMGNLSMAGGELSLNANDTAFVVTGSVTATSSTAETARVTITSGGAGAFKIGAGTKDFTINDGPQPIDFHIHLPIEGDPGAGVRKLGPGVARLTLDSLYTGATTILGGTLLVDGSVANSAVSVDTNTALGGSGAVGSITAASNSRLLVGGASGTGVSSGVHGILDSGPVVLNSTAVFFDVGGGTAGTGYDQLKVTGTIDLGNSTLTLTSALVLPPDGTFTIIDNDGSDPVVGTFAGMAEGATISTEGGGVFTLSYVGGDGNDVVLTNIAPVTYFLSEGATGSFFDEDLLIANPNTAAAPITMTFFVAGGGTVVQQATVPAQSRLTVSVNGIPGLETTSPSVEVKSDNRLTLAVDRTMFWDHATHYGGHTANAVPRPEREWLFAEGVQNSFFQTFLLLGNPNPTDVNATVTFLREGEPSVDKTITLPASSRVTVDAGGFPELVGRSFGMTVSSPLPIGAERATYFASTPARVWSGGHANEGSAKAATSWFHPEGASGTFFSTFILVSNPQDTPAEVTYRFLLTDGRTVETTRTIPAKQRLTINPVDVGDPGLVQAAFSTVVTSNVPVVSERAMYWPGDDTPFGEGHASSGLTTTALDWALAEGRVGGPSAYTTYVLLANPQSTAANVTVTFLRETGDPVVKTYTVAPTSRFNIDVGGMVPELQNESFGTRIEVTNNVPIAVERSLYWNAEGRFWAGGSNALASIIPR